MEAKGVLDPDNEVDLLVLHCLYLPRINYSLEEFGKAWNKHPLQTAHYWSPYKIWMNSSISMDGNYEGDINVPDLEELGIDDEGPLTEEQLNTVVVPDTFSDIDENVLEVFIFDTQLHLS